MNDKPEAVAEYLIRKGAYWYRPNCQGYTTDLAEAGRYTRSEAELYTHPNGPSGPRDGLSYVHESEVPTATPSQDASALVEAAKALCGAIVQDEQGGWRIAGDDPEALACNLHSALTAWEAQHG